MVQILLMLVVLFTQDSKVEDLFCGASSGSEPSLFFSNYFFSLGFQPIQDDFQHDFARMTDEADSSVVLAELQIALFRECNNQRLSPWGRPFSCSPDSIGGGRVVRRCWVNFQCWGVLLIWIIVEQGPIVLAVGAGGGCLDIFFLPLSGRRPDID